MLRQAGRAAVGIRVSLPPGLYVKVVDAFLVVSVGLVAHAHLYLNTLVLGGCRHIVEGRCRRVAQQVGLSLCPCAGNDVIDFAKIVRDVGLGKRMGAVDQDQVVVIRNFDLAGPACIWIYGVILHGGRDLLGRRLRRIVRIQQDRIGYCSSTAYVLAGRGCAVLVIGSIICGIGIRRCVVRCIGVGSGVRIRRRIVRLISFGRNGVLGRICVRHTVFCRICRGILRSVLVMPHSHPYTSRKKQPGCDYYC